MTAKEIGNLGENATCDWLVSHGYTIVQRNFCIRGGEIDIIAQNDQYLAFVEVKTRKANSLVSPAESFTRAQQKRVIITALTYMERFPTERTPSYDVSWVEMRNGRIISLEYISAAYDATDMGIDW